MECGRPARLDAPNHSISFDADTIAKALVNIYQKKYGNGSPDIEPTLFEKTKEILSGAVHTGVAGQRSGKPSDAFIHALTHSTDVFSAFRVHNMQSKIASYLVDSKGKLKPFGQFVKDVKPYITHQNRQWLQTEYDTAVRRAHLAADWQRFEDEKDVLPNLEWKPSTSPNPGEDHKPYWGTILPIDHEFWNLHRPGDRWNCKCSLRNTDKPATSVPAETVASAQPQKGLDSNPGTTGEIFSTSHPYFPENCGVCPFNKGVGKLFAALVGEEIHCYDPCKKIKRALEKSETSHWNTPKVDFVPYSDEIKLRIDCIRDNRQRDELFKAIAKEGDTIYESKGKVTFYKENKGKHSDSWKNTLQMAKDIADSGDDVCFIPEYNGATSADAFTKILGKYRLVDFKCLTTKKWNSAQSDLEHGFEQADSVVLKLTEMDKKNFIITIEYMKRNNIKLGNMKLINKKGKVVDIAKKEFMNAKYIQKIKGFL